MCIIAALAEGAIITDETMERCWTANPDGAGFAWAEGGRVRVVKELSDSDTFILKFREQFGYDPVPHNVLVHWRIGTSGVKNEVNLHPHYVEDDQLVLAHNGIFSHVHVPKGSPVSDTVLFVRHHLSLFRRGFHLSHEALDMLERTIGRFNKLAFLDAQGRMSIANEDAGEWCDETGVWFSNDGYKERKWAGLVKYGYGWADAYDDPVYRYDPVTGEWGEDPDPLDARPPCGFCGFTLIDDEEIENGACEWCIEKYVHDDEYGTYAVEGDDEEGGAHG